MLWPVYCSRADFKWVTVLQVPATAGSKLYTVGAEIYPSQQITGQEKTKQNKKLNNFLKLDMFQSSQEGWIKTYLAL